MKRQTLLCFVAIQAFVCTAALPGFGPPDAGAAVDVAPEPVRPAAYVVDPAASGADDTNPGTEKMPFKTVQHAADMAKPGDTVYVMAGKYDERVRVRAGGAEGRPVVFVAMPRRSASVRGFDLEANYIRIEGFEIAADKPATAVQLRASHCEILDNYIHDMMVAVSGTTGKPSADGNTRDYSAVTHNRIAYNKVYHCEYGFVLGGEDWLVESNEVSRLFMYASGNRYDDCDYSRFFGKGCIQRYNYYHGSSRQEIKTAHVDCLQTFTNNGEIAMDLLFEYNTCFDFHQMCMVESAPHLGSVRGWTLRHNIVSANSPSMRGGWGPDIIQTPDVTIENCTISTVRWAAIGLRGKESTGGLIRNNILCEAERAVDDRMDFTPARPAVEYNLTFKTAPLAGETNINGKDPLFADPRNRDFRLKKDSPAIGAGKDGATIGALEYPNVYYVDPRHPAASDEPAWGYPAVPLATLAKACAIAQPGETIVLRGGVYREVLAPNNDGLTIRAMKGEQVTISGADLIEGWEREADGAWSAPLALEPKNVLRDGRPWSDFSYDKKAKRIMVTSGGDPRLHVFETVVREQGIDLAGKNATTIEGIKEGDKVLFKATKQEVVAPAPAAGPYGAVLAPTMPAGAVVVAAEEGALAKAIDSHGTDTVFYLKSGVHSGNGEMRPKAGSVFIGEAGAILDGGNATARCFIHDTGVLPYAASAPRYVVTLRNLVVRNYTSADQECAVMAEGTGHGWSRVLSDPADRNGWLLDHCTFSSNRAGGAYLGSASTAVGCLFVDNGQIGVKATGRNVQLLACRSTRNNADRKFNYMWEAGGTKFWGVKDMLVDGGEYDHNGGFGLWFDYVWDGNVVRNASFHDNVRPGISIEMAAGVEVTSCTFSNDDLDGLSGEIPAAFRPWDRSPKSGPDLWSGEIMLFNGCAAGTYFDRATKTSYTFSSKTWIHGNRIVDGGGGILCQYQDRGSVDPRRQGRGSQNGPVAGLVGVVIEDNTIDCSAGRAAIITTLPNRDYQDASGSWGPIPAAQAQTQYEGPQFRRNRYSGSVMFRVPKAALTGGSDNIWEWNDRANIDLEKWRSLGKL